jgi:hypothetical protein
MEQSTTDVCKSEDRLILLVKELKMRQKDYKEDSREWTQLQSKIDQFVAERYLMYLNR